MKPDITSLNGLSDQQLTTIETDIEKIGFRKAAAKAAGETKRDIDKSDLQRLDYRSAVKEFLVEGPDTAAACVEILRFAATGRPDFSDGTIKVMEESAFKLSFVCIKSEPQMKALNQLTTMLCRFRNTSVRERMAKVQEQKARLREQEFEWKKSVQAARAESNSAVRAPAASSPKSAIKEGDLDRLAKTLDDVERRTCETFNLPYDGPTKQESSPQTEKNSQAAAPASPSEEQSAVHSPKSAIESPSPLSPLPPVENPQSMSHGE